MNRKIKKLCKIIKTGNISYLWDPKRIQFIPTLKCNLNCKMCHQKDIRRQCELEMNLIMIEQKLKDLKKLGIHQINFSGGEFFVNKKRGFKILDVVEKYGFLFAVATNGFRLEDKDIKKLSQYRGLIEVDVSIDGPHQIHDKIRGVEDAFMWASNTIVKCKDFGIPVATVTVIQKDNIEWLPHITRMFGVWGVDNATFVYEYSVTKTEIENTKNIIRSISGKDSVIFASDSVNKNTFKYDLKELIKQIEAAKYFAKIWELKTNLDSITLDILKSVKNKTITQDYNVKCNSINGISQVDWMGEYDFCPFIRIHGASKEEILAYQKKIKFLPICSRCCGLEIGDKK